MEMVQAAAIPLSGIATIFALSTASINNGSNERGTSRVKSILGLTAGAMAVASGALALDYIGSAAAKRSNGKVIVPLVLGAGALASGSASLWYSTRGMVRRHADGRARPEVAEPIAASIAPLVAPGRAGFIAQVRF
jgi:hypothetical protein